MLTFLTLAQCRLEVFAFVQELVTLFFSNTFGLEPNLVSGAFAFFSKGRLRRIAALSVESWFFVCLAGWFVSQLVS